MLKLIWAALVGGGPVEWAALAAAVVLVLAASFASGALWQASRDVQAAVRATPTAVAAQHNHDAQQHAVAVATDTQVRGADTARDKKFDALMTLLIAKSAVPQKTCDMPPDVVQLLNDAAH